MDCCAGANCLLKVLVDFDDPHHYAMSFLIADRSHMRLNRNDRAISECELHAMGTDSKSLREPECPAKPLRGLKNIGIFQLRNKRAGRHRTIA
jgi:hypothetical protein